MIITFILGCICILLLFNSKSNYQKYLLSSFIFIFIYLAFRYDFGNDYLTYYELFYSTKNLTWNELYMLSNFSQFGESIEFGFLFIMKFFSEFSNFYIFIAFHSLLFCIIYFNLIKKYVDKENAWLAIFILIFHTSLMVRSISGLRQAIAIFCFIYSFKYLINRDFLKYAICSIIAVTFHHSAILLLPIYFLIHIKKINKLEIAVYLSLYILILFASSFFIKPLNIIVDYFIPKYSYYIENEKGNELSTGIGLLVNTIIFLYIIRYGKKDSATDRIFYRMFLIYMTLTPTSIIINNLSRIPLFFAPSLIIVIPNSLKNRPRDVFKISYVALVILMFTYLSIKHYTSPVFIDKNYTYSTVFKLLL